MQVFKINHYCNLDRYPLHFANTLIKVYYKVAYYLTYALITAAWCRLNSRQQIKSQICSTNNKSKLEHGILTIFFDFDLI